MRATETRHGSATVSLPPQDGIANDDPAAVRSKLLVRSAHSLAAQLTSRGAAFLTGIILARALDPTGLGMFALLASLGMMVSSYSMLNIPQALTKISAEQGAPSSSFLLTSFVALFVCSVIASVILVALSGPIALSIYEAPDMVALIPILAVFLMATNLHTGFSALLQGLQSLKQYNWLLVFNALSTLGVVTLGAYLYGLPGAMWGSALGAATYVASAAVITRSVMRQRRIGITGATFSMDQLRRVLAYSLPILMGGAAAATAQWLGATFLVNMQGFAAMGLVRVANTLSANIVLVAVAVGVPLFPMISKFYHSDRDRFIRVAKDSFRLTTIFTYPLCIALILFADPLVVLLFGPSYVDAAPVLRVLALAGFLMALNNNAGSLFFGSGKTMTALYINVSWGVLFTVLAWILVRRFGAMGYAAALLASYLVMTAVQFYYQSRYWRIRFQRLGATVVLVVAGFGSALLVAFSLQGLVGVAAGFLLLLVVCGVEIWMVRSRLPQGRLRVFARDMFFRGRE
jgi:O-antigen/teichoic acid export membrane protein